MSSSGQSLMKRHITAHEALVSTYLENRFYIPKSWKRYHISEVVIEEILSFSPRTGLSLINLHDFLVKLIGSFGAIEGTTLMRSRLGSLEKKVSSASLSKKLPKKSLNTGVSFRG